MRRSWAWVLPVATAAFVLVLGLGLGWWNRADTARRPSQAFSATASLSTREIAFGDPLGARVDVLVDPAVIDPASVLVRPSFGLYHVVGSARRTARGAGDLVSYRYELECLGPSCIPLQPRVQRRFPPVLVAYRTRSGGDGVRSVAWPSYQLTSRVTAAARKAPAASLRYETALPPPSYRIAPGTLRALLTALAAALALAACVLAWLALRPAPGSEEPSESRLVQALRAVQASSANGRPGERRRALGWLGRELRTVRRPAEAEEARQLAWSATVPSAQAAGDFANKVEAAEEVD